MPQSQAKEEITTDPSTGVKRRTESVVDRFLIARNYENDGADVFAGSLLLESGDGQGVVAVMGPVTLNAGYTLVLPDAIGTAGQRLNIASVASDSLTMEWSDIAQADLPQNLLIEAAAAGNIPLTLKAHASQTGDLLIVEDNAGADYLTIDAAGKLTLSGGMVVTGVTTFNTNITVNATISIDNQKKLRFYELDASGADYLGIKAPSSITGALGNIDYTMPEKAASDGEVLTTTAAGATAWLRLWGTAFPASPEDGQMFTRTDLEGETFHWDATRAKWLGELVTMAFGYAATIAAAAQAAPEGSGDVGYNGSRGFCFGENMTIVGCSCFNAVTASATVHWYEGSADLGAILTFTSARGAEDKTTDLDFDGDAAWPHKYPMIKCTAGSPAAINNPVIMVYMRRRAT